MARRSSLLFAMVIAGVLATRPAQAGEVSYQFVRDGLSQVGGTYFQLIGECILATEFTVAAEITRTFSKTGKDTINVVQVQIQVAFACDDGTPEGQSGNFSLLGQLPEAARPLGPSLPGTRIRASVPITSIDGIGQPTDIVVNVDLSFDGTGEIQRNHFRNVERQGDSLIVTTQTGLVRNANVTGTMTANLPLPFGPELVNVSDPEATYAGSLRRVTDGNVTVTRN